MHGCFDTRLAGARFAWWGGAQVEVQLIVRQTYSMRGPSHGPCTDPDGDRSAMMPVHSGWVGCPRATLSTAAHVHAHDAVVEHFCGRLPIALSRCRSLTLVVRRAYPGALEFLIKINASPHLCGLLESTLRITILTQGTCECELSEEHSAMG